MDLFGFSICSVDLERLGFYEYTVDRISDSNAASMFYIDAISKYFLIVPEFQHLCAAESTITLLIKSQILNGIIPLLRKETHNPTDKQIAQRHDDIKQNRLTGSDFFSVLLAQIPTALFSKALLLSGLVPLHACMFPNEERLQSLSPSSTHPPCLFRFFLLLSPHPFLWLGGFQLDGLRALLVALETVTCSLHGGTNVARRTELDPGP